MYIVRLGENNRLEITVLPKRNTVRVIRSSVTGMNMDIGMCLDLDRVRNTIFGLARVG